MSLSEYIREKIGLDGPIPFHDFMEIALYHPVEGYYTSPLPKIGRQGDYYTSPWLTPLFGEMLGKQLEEMWRMLGKGEFKIVEYGAGTGAQCRAILEYLEKHEEFYSQLTYYIIERNTSNLDNKVLENEKVKIITYLKDISGFRGCVMANEVLDNFSVHQVVMQEELMEVFVDYQDGFREVLRPAGEELQSYFQEQGITLPAGFRTEVNLQAIDWLENISRHMKKGYLLTIDYGMLAEELYSPQRSNGTIRCYHKHRMNEQPFNFIGEQDITTHVNFTALAHWGRKVGLEVCGYTEQSQFLLGLGLTNHLREVEIKMKDDPSARKDDIVLLYKFLSEMGKRFKVLIQQKGLDDPKLAGMQFARRI